VICFDVLLYRFQETRCVEIGLHVTTEDCHLPLHRKVQKINRSAPLQIALNKHEGTTQRNKELSPLEYRRSETKVILNIKLLK